MQSNSVYLYKNKIEVQLSDNTTNRRNKIVYADNVILHKDVDNDLFFQCKNSDQRRINVGNIDFTFVMFDEREAEGEFVLELPMTTEDSTTGKLTVVIPEQYLRHLETGFYTYSIVSHDLAGNTKPTYVDDNLDMRGVVELRDGPAPRFKKSQILTFDSMTNLTDVVTDLSSLHQNNGLHTVLLKFDGPTAGYTGTFVIQGTLDNVIQQSTSVNFFDIATVNFLNQEENVTLNFTGSFSGIRFLQGVTEGEITEVQYRF